MELPKTAVVVLELNHRKSPTTIQFTVMCPCDIGRQYTVVVCSVFNIAASLMFYIGIHSVLLP